MTKRPKPRRCKTCKAALTYRGNGRPPSYCEGCDPQKSQTIKRLRKRIDRESKGEAGAQDAAKLEQLGAAPEAEKGPPKAMWPRLLALGLSLGVGARDAAELARLPPELPEVELAALVSEAKAKHGDLIARRSSGIASVISTTMARASLRLLANIDLLPPHLLPSSIASLSKTLIEIQGGTQPSFGEIKINISRSPQPEST